MLKPSGPSDKPFVSSEENDWKESRSPLDDLKEEEEKNTAGPVDELVSTFTTWLAIYSRWWTRRKRRQVAANMVKRKKITFYLIPLLHKWITFRLFPPYTISFPGASLDFALWKRCKLNSSGRELEWSSPMHYVTGAQLNYWYGPHVAFIYTHLTVGPFLLGLVFQGLKWRIRERLRDVRWIFPCPLERSSS